MAGANLTYTQSNSVVREIAKIMGWEGRHSGRGVLENGPNICTKAGAPASNTAADEPTGKGDICLDTSNDDVYISTAHTNSTTHTWTKIN